MTTLNIIRITGRSAIELAEKNDLTLSKFADPTEGARSGLTIAEARDIAASDPGLIYCDVIPTGWTEGDGSGSLGYDISAYFIDGEYQGPDDCGIEPTFALADEPADYSEYAVRVSTEPSYYGSECTQMAANSIVSDLGRMIEGQFPGITVHFWQDGTGSSATTGPDADTVEEIDNWIAENWTAAL